MLLAPIDDGELDIHPLMSREFAIYENKENKKPMLISENMRMYIPEIGDDRPVYEGEGDIRYSIDLIMFSAPIKSRSLGEIDIRFGEVKEQILFPYWCRDGYYFNVYIGEECIATAYYLANAYISKTWFERYIGEYRFFI